LKLFFLSLLAILSIQNTENCIINGDKLIIENNIAKFKVYEEEVFVSKPEFKIVQAFCSDFDKDGEKEVALSLWKYGNFGNSRPFWVKENDNSYKMHLFLYKYSANTLKPFWHSSNLERQNLFMFPVENKIFVIEKPYSKLGLSFAKVEWKSWGFEIVERFELL
jgi:hypothetical protein